MSEPSKPVPADDPRVKLAEDRTVLAAERTGRICRSVEIAPQYVDVAIKRFQQIHPGVPITLIATGQSFEQVVAERTTALDAEVVA